VGELSASGSAFLRAREVLLRRREDYQAAYRLLCDQIRERLTLAQFEAAVTEEPAITSFEISTPISQGRDLLVPATLHRANGSTEQARYRMDQTNAGEFRVCGRER